MKDIPQYTIFTIARIRVGPIGDLTPLRDLIELGETFTKMSNAVCLEFNDEKKTECQFKQRIYDGYVKRSKSLLHLLSVRLISYTIILTFER